MTDATITQRVAAAREKGRHDLDYGSSAALDRLIALERADAADVWTEHIEDHDSGMCGKCWSEGELLAAIGEIERA